VTRRVARLAATLTMSALVALVATAVMLPLVGLRPLVVRSGSMAPALETGDAIVVRSVHPADVAVGDIVTFDDPSGGSHSVTHRVRRVTPRGMSYAFVTQGDANNAAEHWDAAADGKIGRMTLRLPQLGVLLGAIGSPVGRLVLAILPLLWLTVFVLRRIWA
jgi:signal peptidase I